MSEQKVASVDRALALLEAFTEQQPALSLNDLARITGLYKSTVLRLCGSLQSRGYLRRTEDKNFHLGPSLWRLGSLYSRSFKLSDHVYPVLNRLVATTNECASFYVMDKDCRICLYRRASEARVRHHMNEGERMPLERGASGRVLLAFSGAEGEFYENIRRKGWYISMGEFDRDIAAVAAPVLGRDGDLVGSLAVSGLLSRFTKPVAARYAKLVVQEARALSRALGG
ncbi:MAG TPA: IclR family transcriptional regulator [Usitatibacter sp.]|nr:IclR family transcriptional regulator [Usitatibacter sp.]